MKCPTLFEAEQLKSLVPNGGGSDDDGNRAPPRLPRWTRQEILLLIQGKRVAENRVRRGRPVGTALGEPKWASVSSYCKRHGVDRRPIQCRKRWSNLSGDYKKIKEWESSSVVVREKQEEGESSSYWAMRSDLRRERKLPGFFDREVYDLLNGGTTAAMEDGTTIPNPVPISERQYHPLSRGCPSQELVVGATLGKQQQTTDPEMGAAYQQARKRKRIVADGDEETNTLQSQLIEVLEQNGRMVSEQLESQNTNFQLDREQRRDHVNNLVVVFSKLTDALGRIADKL